jgi:hypothetical protein
MVNTMKPAQAFGRKIFVQIANAQDCEPSEFINAFAMVRNTVTCSGSSKIVPLRTPYLSSLLWQCASGVHSSASYDEANEMIQIDFQYFLMIW